MKKKKIEKVVLLLLRASLKVTMSAQTSSFWENCVDNCERTPEGLFVHCTVESRIKLIVSLQ